MKNRESVRCDLRDSKILIHFRGYFEVFNGSFMFTDGGIDKAKIGADFGSTCNLLRGVVRAWIVNRGRIVPKTVPAQLRTPGLRRL
jgi:hypothetical protein